MRKLADFVWNSDGVSNLLWRCDHCDFGTYDYYQAYEHSETAHDYFTVLMSAPDFLDELRWIK